MPHTFNISDSEYSRHSACAAIVSAPDGRVVVFTRKMTLSSNSVRDRAMALVRALKSGWRMSIREPNRTQEQNDKLWAMLTDLSRAKPLGRAHPPDQWKAIMMRACGHEIGYLIDIEGEPFPIGYRSSKLKVKEMADLITYIYSFGDEHGVVWNEPKEAQQSPEGTSQKQHRHSSP